MGMHGQGSRGAVGTTKGAQCLHHLANAFKVPVYWYHLFSTLLSKVTN